MARRQRIILGLNSGTSADGVDAVACEIAGRGVSMRVRVLGHVHRRYDPGLRRRIVAAMAPAETRTEEICRLDAEIGRAFARTAAAAVKKLDLKGLDLIGSHGQTVCHLPPGGVSLGKQGTGRRSVAGKTVGTMQIGDPAIIALSLSAAVVSHFRQADMAVGGQGAPLVPWTDYVLFRHPKRNRIIQNIGGIANLTWLPAGADLDDVIAFDSGPGNMVIDDLVRHFTKGRESFDRAGRRAARGTPHPVVLERLLAHPYLAKSPPKSCGREDFGEAWLRRTMAYFAVAQASRLCLHRRDGGATRRSGRVLNAADWIATATAFTAASIARAYVLHLPARRGGLPRIDEVLVCGGGAGNSTLLCDLAGYLAFESDEELDGVPISTTADLGIPPQAKEAVSFAMLAAACVDRVPANLPRVTGAGRRVVLGQICNPEPRGQVP